MLLGQWTGCLLATTGIHRTRMEFMFAVLENMHFQDQEGDGRITYTCTLRGRFCGWAVGRKDFVILSAVLNVRVLPPAGCI